MERRAQELVDSIVCNADRLLSHWWSRALCPGCTDIQTLLQTLLQTISLQPLSLKIELTEMSERVSGNLHLFEDPNFAISLDTLTARELKQLCVLLAARRCFSSIYDNRSTNTTIFSGLTLSLQLTETQRLQLVETACIYSLFLCKQLNQANILQLKDVLHSVVLHVLSQTHSPSLIRGLSDLALQLRQPILSQLEQLVQRHSPPNSRLRQSLEEHEQNTPRARAEQQPQHRNYYLGDDWFAQAYAAYPS